MQIDRSYAQIVKAFGKAGKSLRDGGTQTQLRKDGINGPELAVTNGHFLTVIPVTVSESDINGTIPENAIRAAVKGTSRFCDITLEPSAKFVRVPVAEQSWDRADDIPLEYPRVQTQAPKRGGEGTLSFALDVNILAKAVAGLTESGKVILTVDQANPTVYRVDPYHPLDSEFAVVMGLTLKD